MTEAEVAQLLEASIYLLAIAFVIRIIRRTF